MELRYVILTIIKILISVPSIVLNQPLPTTDVLMGGHIDNKNGTNTVTNKTFSPSTPEEDIPNPSPLVRPGYNLPENIFNKGKPFYLEKDPLTGQIDFDSKTSSLDDLYEYVDEEPKTDIFDKANIDRKDGSLGSHRPSDVNQLTPNFHDFLNLPVKYNSEKYVYPLISSSYANTKVQGNVNNYQNHKNYNVKTTTLKPTSTPMYYSTSTTPAPSLMSTGMNHPSFQEDFEYYDEKPTMKNVNTIYITTTAPTTTTKRALSVFEQLFGDYEYEQVTTTQRPKPPSLPSLFPNVLTEEKPAVSNSHGGPNVLTGTNMGIDSYEYDDEETAPTQAPPKVVEVTTQKPSSTTTVTTTVTTTTSKVPPPTAPKTEDVYYDYDYEDKANETVSERVETTSSTSRVTSLPLGENHIVGLNNHQPIIVATQNLREHLNHERVNVSQPPSTGTVVNISQPPSTSNIHIAPHQDTVSFVVGNHQHVDGDGQYVGTSLKESPYDSNPFRPLYPEKKAPVRFSPPPEDAAGLITGTIQPLQSSEASLAIGVPVGGVKQVPGQVMDEALETNEENVEFPKGTGTKVVFPEEKDSYPPREVLQLNSKPMYHQLPSDLTPPREKEVVPVNRPRPPWDPRPGHFHSGRPEYARPPRPQVDLAYKRIDNLPNILPQFRPNVKPKVPQYLNRQPLLDRASNRPIGFFEKLQPPPPPKNFNRMGPPMEYRHHDKVMVPDQYPFYQTPPKAIATRRIGNLEGDVETLQMIQAKKKEGDVITDKPLYVVYPVNTPPIKLDVIDNSNAKESVVIGTRAELPLPPSKIRESFDYEQNPILNPKDRNDAPLLKPHRGTNSNTPIKSEFPYPLERPVENPSGNNLDEADFLSNNQWSSVGGDGVEGRIVNGGKGRPNQISVTLKTWTEKPIAVAYTPTEPYEKYDPDKYSMPNYGSPVIPEIRPGVVESAPHGKPDSEFTVSAVMHTHPQLEQKHQAEDKTDAEVPQLEFQAPFQASVNVDSVSQGWSVVRDRSKGATEQAESATVVPLATTSEFDIENFKPQLIGGFRPIYSFPEEAAKGKETEINEREE